jgi:TRAP-type C4-dicarboxylate transport system permease small subunit
MPGNPQQTTDGSVQLGATQQTQTVYMSNLFNPESTSLEAFFNMLFVSAIAIGAALAVIRLAYAGVVYMTTDLVTSKQNARQMIADVVLGLIVLLAIWVILFQINPDLLNLDILRSVRNTPQ